MAATISKAERKERIRRGSRIARWQTWLGGALLLLCYATAAVFQFVGPIPGAALGVVTVLGFVAAVRLQRAYRRLAGEPGRWRERELISEIHDEIPWEIRLLLRFSSWR